MCALVGTAALLLAACDDSAPSASSGLPAATEPSAAGEDASGPPAHDTNTPGPSADGAYTMGSGDDVIVVNPSGEATYAGEAPVDDVQDLPTGNQYLPYALPLSIGDYHLVSRRLDGATCDDVPLDQWNRFNVGNTTSAQAFYSNDEGVRYLNTLEGCGSARVADGMTDETNPGLIEILVGSNERGTQSPTPVCRTGELIVACHRLFGDTWYASAKAGRGGDTEPSEVFLASFLNAFIENTTVTHEALQR